MIVDIKAQKFMLSFEAVQNKCIEVNIILVPPCEVISLHHIIAKNAPTTMGRQSTDNALFGRGFQKEKTERSLQTCASSSW